MGNCIFFMVLYLLLGPFALLMFSTEKYRRKTDEKDP